MYKHLQYRVLSGFFPDKLTPLPFSASYYNPLPCVASILGLYVVCSTCPDTQLYNLDEICRRFMQKRLESLLLFCLLRRSEFQVKRIVLVSILVFIMCYVFWFQLGTSTWCCYQPFNRVYVASSLLKPILAVNLTSITVAFILMTVIQIWTRE